MSRFAFFSALSHPDSRRRCLKTFGLALFCLVWIVIGLTGHAPWKTEDAKTIVTAWEMSQDRSYLAPHLIEQPNFEQGVLVPQLASLTLRLFSPPLQSHDAARLAAGVLLFITLLFTALTARALNHDPSPESRAKFWLPMFVLIGSVGLFDRAHMLSPQIGAMASVAVGAFAWALMLRRPGTGGIVLGVAAAFGALSYYVGFLAVFVLTSALLPLLSDAWRTKFYAMATGLAAVIAAVLVAVYLILLSLQSPELLALWWQTQLNSLSTDAVGRNFLWLLKNIWWLAFPSWVLIAWLIRIRCRGFNGGFATPPVTLFALLSAMLVLFFLVSHNARAIDTLMLLVPLALLASEEVDTLPRSGSAGLDWFGIMAFGLSAVALWYFWWDVYLHGMGSYAAHLFRDAEAGFESSFRLRAAAASLLLTILWVMLVRPARQSARRAVLNWAAGMMLVSGLVSTIWMPYLDSRRSYQVVADMLTPYVKEGCFATANVFEAQRATFYYYTGAVTQPLKAGETENGCPLLITQFKPTSDLVDALKIDGYKLLATRHRYGDNEEYYALYRKER
jgi:4-amino-4-deoxy-L-arabinose transferase-like glycosyltransferase